jgi:chemotaxis protein methyltransferase CheR
MSLARAPGSNSPISAQEPIPQLLRDLIHERTGVFCEADRFDTMLEKIEARARDLNCVSFLDYYYILKYNEKGDEEWRRVMDALSVQETYFWREFDQVRVLVDVIIPKLAQQGRPIRVWSAACASGEEPYSIAMALAERGWSGPPVEIIGSDASEAALAKAKAGLFRERSFRALPPELRAKYFEQQRDGYFLHPEIRSKVTFHWANLMRLEEFPLTEHVDVIFCRNVFIYFSPTAIKRVIAMFSRRLAAGGHLFVGSSESLLKLTSQFDLQEISGAFAYVRNGAN